MTTNNTQNTSRLRIGDRLRQWKKYGIGIGLTAAAVAGLITARTALADPTGLSIVPLAQGFSTQHEIHIQAHGPNDVLQAQLVFQPGGDTGWHTHPGPVVVVVKSGALTEIHKNGCVSVHPAGSVFFESAGEVHRAINQTGVVSEVYATFISPAGAPPLQPAGNPGGTCRDGD